MSEQSLMHVICIQSQIPPKCYVNYLKQNNIKVTSWEIHFLISSQNYFNIYSKNGEIQSQIYQIENPKLQCQNCGVGWMSILTLSQNNLSDNH